MTLLARRDYSRQELRDKLRRRFSGHSATPYSPDSLLDDDSEEHVADSVAAGECLDALIDRELAALAAENLQSDERFLESFINGRKAKGHGPYKIRQALRGKGVSDALLEHWLDDQDEDWVILAEAVYHKKFGHSPPQDYREKARRMRFLQQRGFPGWVMEQLL